MLSSAVSLVFLLAATQPQTNSAPGRLAPRTAQEQAWNSVSRSIAHVQSNKGLVTGLAVLIDDRGIFLAHQVAMPSPEAQATISGHLFTLKVLATDEQTQLVALQAQNWKPRAMPVIKVGSRELKEGETLLAATTTGPMQSELVSNSRAGVMKPSLRYTPLQELKFERTPEGVGGALVFNARGELVGVLGATRPKWLWAVPPGRGSRQTVRKCRILARRVSRSDTRSAPTLLAAWWRGSDQRITELIIRVSAFSSGPVLGKER